MTIIPKPNKEVELEQHIKDVNAGFYKAVREIKRFHPTAARTGVMPVHRLFLERYEFFDFVTGRVIYLVRIIKPISRNFMAGTMDLNPVGLYHLRSYVLQELGLVSNINTWDGMQTRAEPVEIQQEKRQAWLKAQGWAKGEDEQEEQGDTDVEDEMNITVVPDSLADSDSTGNSGSIPVVTPRRAVEYKL